MLQPHSKDAHQAKHHKQSQACCQEHVTIIAMLGTMMNLVGWPNLVNFRFFCDAGMHSMGPAVQYLAGELSVEQGMVLPLLASHNTVRMRFDIEQAEYLHLAKPDAAFPPLHFAMLADDGRNQVNSPSPQTPCTATFLTLSSAST